MGKKRQWAVKPLVPEEVYTDRQEYLDYFHQAVLEEEPRIDLAHIQEKLWQQEGEHVEMETIKDVLVKLSRGDLIDYKPFGGWFNKINDPILEAFLKVWGRIEVVGENRASVIDDTRK